MSERVTQGLPSVPAVLQLKDGEKIPLHLGVELSLVETELMLRKKLNALVGEGIIPGYVLYRVHDSFQIEVKNE